MSAAAANFDSVARAYRALEHLALGGDLERTRFSLLDRLAGRRSILILGEGDGRCLARLLPLVPGARIHCLDASPAMLALARARIAGTTDAHRVTLECADVLTYAFPPARYDAVITLFLLDCFEPAQAADLVTRIQAALQPGAGWLFADFKRTTDFDLRNEWSSEMNQLAERGWAARDAEKFHLTHQGLRFADAAAEMFLR